MTLPDPEVPPATEPTTSSATPRRVAPPEDKTSAAGAVGWTVLGTLIPGVGLWRAGHRLVGAFVLGIALILAGGLVALALSGRQNLAALVVRPDVLLGLTIGLLVLGVALAALATATYLSLRPSSAGMVQRVLGAGFVGLLSFALVAPLAFASNLAYSTIGVANLFEDDDDTSATEPTIANTVDPWEDIPRLNVLIIGGDHGTGRSEANGIRADTVIVASIDTHTGDTTLFSLPRNTVKMPFPKDSPLSTYYPNGFYDGSNPANAEYFLNAMYRNVPARVPSDILGKTKNLGADVMKLSVGEALGLDIDYYVQVDMDGFKDFINAIGGITINVNYRVPIGGQTDKNIAPKEYIEPGPNQKMKGSRALWYARGRYGLDDYSRMERQRCVINAVVQQANAQNLLLNYQKVAEAGQKSVRTDVPRKLLPALTELAVKVQGTKLRSIVFENGKDGWVWGNPNWKLVRSQVKKALKETAASNTSSETASASPGTETPSASASQSSSSASPSTSKTSKAKSDDLDAACAYDPEKAKKS